MNSFALGWATTVALLLCAPAEAAINCYIKQAGTVRFTDYDVTSPIPNDGAVDLVVECTRDSGPPSVIVQVALGPSAVSGSVGTRRMRQLGGAGELLTYNLFRNAARSAVWGDTSGVDTQVQTIPNVPSNNKGSASVTFTVYGRIQPLQDVAVGTYTDSVLVTITP
ncbi:Csu type fimbrial protein [Ramlibacter sp.]|uniref:Csu type fimbrial protein n=1 Tax=Ramlibacter sp. TaxID=1917967 RepID=UPI002FC9296C